MWIPQITHMNKGKRQIIQLLNRNVVANVTMMRVVQVVCYIASVVVFALSIWNLTRSDLTGTQIILGMLVSSLGPLVFLGIGLLLPMVTSSKDTQIE